MKVQWKKLLLKISLWLVTEIWLSFLGIDNLADYSEYVLEKHIIVQPLLIFYSISRARSP
ncbi:hypothetical protein [Pleurocapsa sp. PCC 7319]|uniref:hypothetical protein n=1 Tax=Pleurocapsa sp. PCC 7319 TaxID=118161 RepID=UPI000347E4B5|nr:hypothetical protein [Pleurocapsa sp. PCC 7319]